MGQKKIKKILEGWRNTIIPPDRLVEVINHAYIYRSNICTDCIWHSNNNRTQASKIRPDDHCTHCGCTLIAKLKCLSCRCPIDKWEEVVED